MEKVVRKSGSIILWTSVALLTVAVAAYAYTFEGELDPEVFLKWKVIEGTTRLVNPTTMSAMVENPDEESGIERIQIFIDRHQELTDYRYFKNGEVFHYHLDRERNKYIRHLYTGRELRECMGCHKGIGLHCS